MKTNKAQQKKQTTKKLPEKLIDALLTERPFEESKLHLACIDGGHGGVPEASDPQCVLQFILCSSFCPQPPGRADGFRVRMLFVLD